MSRVIAVVAFVAALTLGLFAAATVPSLAAAGSLSLKISPSELTPLESATLSGKVAPRLPKAAKLYVQASADNKVFSTIRTVTLPKGATKFSTTYVAGTVLGPVYLRVKFGRLATKGLKVTVTQIITVRIHDMAFSDATLTVPRWTTVLWSNDDTVQHTVTSVDSLDLAAATTGLFDSHPIPVGGSFRYTFAKTGTVFYECTIHSDVPALHAEVIVQ
jgi:plastocyanin